jgi:hypothetical protein
MVARPRISDERQDPGRCYQQNDVSLEVVELTAVEQLLGSRSEPAIRARSCQPPMDEFGRRVKFLLCALNTLGIHVGPETVVVRADDLLANLPDSDEVDDAVELCLKVISIRGEGSRIPCFGSIAGDVRSIKPLSDIGRHLVGIQSHVAGS